MSPASRCDFSSFSKVFANLLQKYDLFLGFARKMGNNLKQNDSYDNYSYDSFVLKIRVFGGYDL